MKDEILNIEVSELRIVQFIHSRLFINTRPVTQNGHQYNSKILFLIQQ